MIKITIKFDSANGYYYNDYNYSTNKTFCGLCESIKSAYNGRLQILFLNRS